jgi:hypothetical protein
MLFLHPFLLLLISSCRFLFTSSCLSSLHVACPFLSSYFLNSTPACTLSSYFLPTGASIPGVISFLSVVLLSSYDMSVPPFLPFLPPFLPSLPPFLPFPLPFLPPLPVFLTTTPLHPVLWPADNGRHNCRFPIKLGGRVAEAPPAPSHPF